MPREAQPQPQLPRRTMADRITDTQQYTQRGIDMHTWVEVRRVLPKECDLVELQTNNRTCVGWWTGSEWHGLRLRSSDVVTHWKRMRQPI